MNITKENLKLIEFLHNTVTEFNLTKATHYENCIFTVEPRIFTEDDEVLMGYNLYYGCDFLQYRVYVGFKFLTWMMENDRFFDFLIGHAEKYAYDYYTRVGY